MTATVYLMYHELELPGRALCQSDPGYTRYVLSASDFRAQMQKLQESGRKGVSVGQALSSPEQTAIALTFDDGCGTDLLVAAPLLLSLNFNATFYITFGFLDTPGYLTKAQVLQLSDMGFEIGSHSMTHAYLPDLGSAGLRYEISESKMNLEQILGKSVEHFSCPGGRTSGRVEEAAKAAGYRTVVTSRLRANDNATNRFSLGRVAVMRGTPLHDFQSLCDGRGFLQRNLRSSFQQGAKQLLGNSLYDRVRSVILKQASQ